MEIYTEGSTDTIGTLYNNCKTPIAFDDDTNGNGNFKITYHLKAKQFYYISVRNYSNRLGFYELKFKFIRDYHDTISGQYNLLLWKNLDNPQATSSNYIDVEKVFITEEAMNAYATIVIENYPNHKPNLKNALTGEITSELSNTLRDMAISEMFPIYGDFISLALNVGEIIYNNMDPASSVKDQYTEIWNKIYMGSSGYITGVTSQKKVMAGYSNKLNYILQGPASREYEGVTYQRGVFTKMKIG